MAGTPKTINVLGTGTKEGVATAEEGAGLGSGGRQGGGHFRVVLAGRGGRSPRKGVGRVACHFGPKRCSIQGERRVHVQGRVNGVCPAGRLAGCGAEPQGARWEP